jgi:hypothetical protein
VTPRAKTTALPDSSDQVGSDSKGGDPDGIASLLDPIAHPVTVAIRFPNPPSLGLVWVWDFVVGITEGENHKNQLYRRRDLNPHALAGNGF